MFNKILFLLLLVYKINAQLYLSCGRDECLETVNCNSGYTCTFCVENEKWKRTCTKYGSVYNNTNSINPITTSTHINIPTNTITNNLNNENNKNIFDTKMIIIIVENSFIVIIIVIIIILKLCGCINKNKNKLDIYEKKINILENKNRELKSRNYEYELKERNND